jgi:hypothetical protein
LATAKGASSGPTHMDPKRQSKRDSAKKSKDHSIYTQKSIRTKEALLEKKLSCLTQVKGQSK